MEAQTRAGAAKRPGVLLGLQVARASVPSRSSGGWRLMGKGEVGGSAQP